jgi:hypothetical protein
MADYSGQNIFEKIGTIIPGYRGYSEREGRRECDKLLRDRIADDLGQCRNRLVIVAKELVLGGLLEQAMTVEELQQGITIIADQVRFAAHGASGFFDAIQVDERVLDRVYLHDLRIHECSQDVLASVEKAILSKIVVQSATLIEKKLGDLHTLVTNRGRIIQEIE